MKSLFLSILTCFILLLAIVGSPQEAKGQTVYKQEQGFFTPVLSSFYLRGGSVESTQKIGPAVGYRINQHIDVSLHAEYLSAEAKEFNLQNYDFSLLNIGLTGGYTRDLSKMKLRAEAGVYRAFNLSTSENTAPEPESVSTRLYAGIYYPLTISKRISLFPNAGLAATTGTYRMPGISTELTQYSDGFLMGPQLGLDMNIEFSSGLIFTISPEIMINYSPVHSTSDTDFSLRFIINF